MSMALHMLFACTVLEREIQNGSCAQPGTPLLDPRLRCFSDLRAWLDANLAALAGRKVLMYCTGGVRCERASAYLHSKGPTFQDVVQLQGIVENSSTPL
jgi:hypothetical protein